MIALFLNMLISTAIIVASLLAVWALVEMLKLIGAIDIIAHIAHFAFRAIPAVLLAAVIMYPEDMFAYLLLLGFWVPFYVLTCKEK